MTKHIDPSAELEKLNNFYDVKRAELEESLAEKERAAVERAEKIAAKEREAAEEEASEHARYVLECSKKIDALLAEVARLLVERRESSEQVRRRAPWAWRAGNIFHQAGPASSALNAAGVAALVRMPLRGRMKLAEHDQQWLNAYDLRARKEDVAHAA